MANPFACSALFVALLALLAGDGHGRPAVSGSGGAVANVTAERPALSASALRPALKEPSVADISYLEPHRAEKMDAWFPPAGTPKPWPAVLLIHGGGWQVGDKADRRELNIAGVLAANGYAVFSVNYLLAQRYRDEQTGRTAYTESWPQNFEDCRTAVRYLRQHAGELGIDPQRIAVMGTSAGAHLAMLLAVHAAQDAAAGDARPAGQGAATGGALYTAQGADGGRTLYTGQSASGSGMLYAGQSEAVSAVINFYGIHDLRRFSPAVTRLLFAGQTPEQTEANLTAASPVSYIGRVAVPPMLVVHGTADKTVDISLSRDLVEDLRRAGDVAELIEVPDAGHSFHLQPAQQDLRVPVLEFLNRYL